MQMSSSTFVRGITAFAVVTGLAVASIPAFSQPDAANANRPEQIRQHVQHRLDKMAERLRITPAQQNAWAQYRNTVESMMGAAPTPPAKDADAATIVRYRADRASEHARKMVAVADATATLQTALDAEQRKTLGEIVRREDRRGEHRGHKDRTTTK